MINNRLSQVVSKGQFVVLNKFSYFSETEQYTKYILSLIQSCKINFNVIIFGINNAIDF